MFKGLGSLINTLTLTVLLASAKDTPPNVILIYADDLGMGLLSKYGQPYLTTPHIDSLAERGMTMNRYYGSTYCAPARHALLTGMHDGYSGAGSHSRGGFITTLDRQEKNPQQWQQKYDLHITERQQAVPIPESEVFLAQVAQNAGLTTAQFGKLDVGFLTWHERVSRLGWEHYVGYYDHTRAHGFYPSYLWKNGNKLPLEGNHRWDAGKANENASEPVGSLGQTYSQDVLLDELVDFIDQNKERPFFLYHSTQLPHGPAAINALHPEVANNDALTFSEKKYASMVKMLDDHVGIILAELKRHHLEENTLIFFTSDNGHESYYINKQGQSAKKLNTTSKGKKWRTSDGGDTFNGSAGMVGLKRDLFEGGIHSPMFVVWPGRIAPNSTTEHLATHYDFMATLADVLGQPLPKGKDSLSYLPALLGKPHQEQHNWIYISGFKNQGFTLITREGWKLIHSPKIGTHLYSLQDNFLEQSNVADQHPDLVQQLLSIGQNQFNKERGDLNVSLD